MLATQRGRVYLVVDKQFFPVFDGARRRDDHQMRRWPRRRCLPQNELRFNFKIKFVCFLFFLLFLWWCPGIVSNYNDLIVVLPAIHENGTGPWRIPRQASVAGARVIAHCERPGRAIDAGPDTARTMPMARVQRPIARLWAPLADDWSTNLDAEAHTKKYMTYASSAPTR